MSSYNNLSRVLTRKSDFKVGWGEKAKSVFFLFIIIHPRKHKITHTPTVAQGGGGGRLNDRPCFAVLQLHDCEKILPSYVLSKMR